jgi:hypothetical protein
MSMNRAQFLQSLQRLETMAKGGATQLHHTPSDSDPGNWAGTSTSDDQDEHNDGIDDNGTDYNGVRKALAMKVERQKALSKAEVAIVKGQDPRPFIMAKIQKGERLTQAESWALKGGVAQILKSGTDMPSGGAEMGGSTTKPGESKDANSAPPTHAGDKTEDIEPDAKKSLQSGIAKSDGLRKGIEMSGILAEFARAMGEGLAGVEARTAQNIQKSLLAALEPVFARMGEIEKSLSRQEEFSKGFSEAIIGIGQHVAGGTEVATAQATMPAGPPQSQLRAIPGGQAPQQYQGVQAVQKSFGPGGLDVSMGNLQKSQIIDVMTDLVEKGRLNSLDVVKFETQNEISPQAQALVSQHLAGGMA